MLWHRSHNIARVVVSAYVILFLTIGDTGFWLYAGVYICMIKDEISETIQENIREKTLATITIANSSTSKGRLVWTEKDKEFQYQGEMYDVVRSIASADSTEYFCIKDTRENALRYQIDRHAKNESGISFALGRFDLKIVKDFKKTLLQDILFPRVCDYPEWSVRHDDDPDSELVTPPPKSC